MSEFKVIAPTDIKIDYAAESKYGSNYVETGLSFSPFNYCEAINFPTSSVLLEEEEKYGLGLNATFLKYKVESEEMEITTYMQDHLFLAKVFEDLLNKSSPSYVFRTEMSTGNKFVSYGCYITSYEIFAEDGTYIKEKIKLKSSYTNKTASAITQGFKNNNPFLSKDLKLEVMLGGVYKDIREVEKLSLLINFKFLDIRAFNGLHNIIPVVRKQLPEIKISTYFMDLEGAVGGGNVVHGIIYPNQDINGAPSIVDLSERDFNFRIILSNVPTGTGNKIITLTLNNMYLNTDTIKEITQDNFKKFELTFIAGPLTNMVYSIV